MRLLIALAATLTLVIPISASAQPQQTRSADAIIAEFDKAEKPAFDATRNGQPGYAEEFAAARKEWRQTQARLAEELFRTDPDHPRIVELMKTRWQTLLNEAPDGKALISETEALLKERPHHPLAPVAAGMRISALGNLRHWHPATMLTEVEAFIKAYPGDTRAGGYLFSIAEAEQDEVKQVALYQRIINEFPKSARFAPGKIRQIRELGKPFDLEFTDAVSGRRVSMADLKGKVVVIDFWATWCGPCVGAMPHMKELYAKYKDSGVEFIGVSLDYPEEQGGLTKLKNFVAVHEIPWPQYYQGDSWEGEFSKSWGINEVPMLFLVDARGNLVTTRAQDNLDDLIKQQLESKAKPAARR
jgi:thiol-disulfide isomerase/thioredoxin